MDIGLVYLLDIGLSLRVREIYVQHEDEINQWNDEMKGPFENNLFSWNWKFIIESIIDKTKN